MHLKVEHFELVPPDLECPTVNNCLYPSFDELCVTGGEAVLNGTGGVVAVTAHTWSEVKAMYR